MCRMSLALLLILPHWLHAQTRLDDIKVGARIRVTAPSALAGRYDALIAARRGDTLVLVSSGMPAVEVPISSVTRAEIFTGKSVAAGAVRGATIGGIAGALMGLIGIIDGSGGENYCDGNSQNCVETSALEDAAIMTTLSLLTGAAIGAGVRRARWQTLDVTHPRVSLIVPSSSRVGIGLRIAVR